MELLRVLCFNCGGTFYVKSGTKNPTQQCGRCNKRVDKE